MRITSKWAKMLSE